MSDNLVVSQALGPLTVSEEEKAEIARNTQLACRRYWHKGSPADEHSRYQWLVRYERAFGVPYDDRPDRRFALELERGQRSVSNNRAVTTRLRSKKLPMELPIIRKPEA